MMRQTNTAGSPTENEDASSLSLPSVRCLSKEHAAEYLGIGLTLLAELDIPCVKFGRRRVYDKVDLDAWLDEYKQRGRARKETLWPVKLESIGGRIPASGGLMQYSLAANAYAEALKPRTERKRKRF